MANDAVALPRPAVHTKLNRHQITGFWGAWAGWTLDGMDSVIYALVLSPALTELLPKSGIKATPATVGYAGSVLFALFLGSLPGTFRRHNLVSQLRHRLG